MGIFSRRESYKVACPHCRAKLKIERAEVARGRFRCPSCGRGNPIPHDVQAAFGLRRAKEREKQQAREQMKREREQARQEQQAAQGSGQEHAGPESTSAVVAARWAAKEAVAKALGTGIGEGCGWRDVLVRRATAGRPVVHLWGNARRTAAELGVGTMHLTISHSRGLACACAVAERESSATDTGERAP